MRAIGVCLLLTLCLSTVAHAQPTDACRSLPSHDAVRKALAAAQAQPNGGLAFHMWATIVDRDGVVCVVAFSGNDRGDQWPGSRVISAQKANTANAFSLPKFALSTANLYTAVQPGQSLFGLQESNPVDTAVAYGGNAVQFGTATDPMVGHRVGGVNVFGGGLALYDTTGRLLGGLGVSGDTSCADHIIAWKVRGRGQGQHHSRRHSGSCDRSHDEQERLGTPGLQRGLDDDGQQFADQPPDRIGSLTTVN